MAISKHIFSRLYLRVFLIAILASFTLLIQAKPASEFPSFKRLSTEQGLPQNSVLALMLDNQGFLWAGTENGLTRYDGYHVQHIEGSNGELKDAIVNYLYEDNKLNIYISVENVGLYKFSRHDQFLELIVNLPYQDYPEYYQSTIKILENASRELIVALEENIVVLDPKTNEFENILSLPPNLINDQHIIRDIIFVEDVIVIATSNGLFAYQMNTKKFVEVDYLDIESPSPNMLNSKKLFMPNEQNLWVGTVEGLYHIRIDELKEFVNKGTTLSNTKILEPTLNVWDIKKLDGDTYYLATDKGLFTYSDFKHNIQHLFRPTDSRYYIADDDLVSIQKDLHNNLWLGTQFDGVLYWSPKNLLFTNVYKKTSQTGALSDNQVWSFYQQNEEFLWVGTNNGLNRFNLFTGDIDAYLVNDDPKALYSDSTIDQILKFDENNLLLVTAEGFKLFDHVNGKSSNIKLSATNVDGMDIYPWGVQSDGNGKFYFLTESGWFIYDSTEQEIQSIEVLDSQLDHLASYGFLRPDINRPNKLLISMPKELWEYDTKTNQVQLLHFIPEYKSKAEIFPESYIYSEQKLYINYTGYGLTVLDSNSFTLLETYDKTNGLQTPTTYGLQQANNGEFWLSSHSGLLKFNPDTRVFKPFTQSEGLLTNEFNAFASLTLIDGRLVYGSLKGFTIFEPTEFQAIGQKPEVYVSGHGINAENIDLKFNDYQKLSKQLNYDDAGLTLFYSTLKYEEISHTEYKVELQGNSSLRFPISKESSVTFPRLSPGEYTIAISAKDSVSGQFGRPTLINLSVGYFLWTHPLAIAIYSLTLLLLVTIWINNRNTQLRALNLAHQTTLNAKNKLSQALQATNSSTWEWSLNNDSYSSDAYEKLGYDFKQSPRNFKQHLLLVHPNDQDKAIKHWDAVRAGRKNQIYLAYRIKALDGSYQWFRDTGKLIADSDQHKKIVGTSTIITDMVADHERATLFGEAFKQTNDWVLFFDENYQLINANPSFLRALGIEDTDFLSQSFAALLEREDVDFGKIFNVIKHLETNDRFKFEDKLILPNNENHFVIVNVNPIDNPQNLTDSKLYLAIISNINEQKQAEHKLIKLANYDSLTGLPNRMLLNDRIEHALQTAKSANHIIALMFLDLDRFKQVNDSLGHNIGDELLVEISKRLTNVCEGADTVARLGGDEFVIMKEHLGTVTAISVFAQQVIETVEQPIKLSNQLVNISTSIGIAIYPDDAITASELMRNADLAMYSAKEQGRGCFQLFTNELNQKLHERLYMESKLKAAYQNEQLINYYQPIVDVTKQKVIGFELLLRWQDDKTMVPPSEFILLAEEIGLIEDITLQAIKRLAPVMKTWLAVGFEGYISINLSARHIDREASLERIIQLIHELDIPAKSIQFELTESALMKSYEDAQFFIQKLCDSGFRIALDDFGTGYSSLKYLKTFPIHSIKIDRNFVFDVGLDKNDEAIISAILKMADSLNLDCIAEGIENRNQLSFLFNRGCIYQQGYYFSKPVIAEATIALLKGLDCYQS